MPETNIHEFVLDIIRVYADEDYGLTIREIITQLPDFDPEDVQDAVQHLCEEDHLIEIDTGGKSRFNLPERIKKMNFHDDLEDVAAKQSDLWLADEAVRKAQSERVLEKIAQKSVLHSIAENYTSEEDFATAVRDIATTIAKENPVDLILEMVEWVVDDINALADALSIDFAGQPAKVNRIAREIDFRAKKAERLFQRLLRLDDDLILTIPNVRNMERRSARVRFNRELARERLQERILGSHFIEVVEVPENANKSAVGTDASIGDIFINHARGSFIPPIPASLFIAGAAMRVVLNHGQDSHQQYWDYDINPREIESYAEFRAAEEGLFITPNLKGEVITDFQHLSIAAMELRQYLEELRVINGQANWHPFGEVPELRIPPTLNLIFRDGRIFPLVHRIEDYEGASAPDDLLYGAIVRKEINTFHSVFHNTAGRGQLGATYAGAVKSPAFSWLSMIVFWYLYKVTGEEVFRTKFYRPPLNDQAVSHLLFWGICKDKPELTVLDSRFALLTFRVIRRFSDIAFLSHPIGFQEDNQYYVVDEDSEEDWIRYIQYHIKEVDRSHREHRRGLGSLGSIEEYHNFIDLCRRASVAMFYGTPGRIYEATIKHHAHALMPRWEVGIDISQSNVSSTVERKLENVLMWITDVDGLDKDGKHAVGGFNEVSSSLPLFIPDVVAAAHNAVTFSRTEQTRLVEDMIYDLIKLIRHSNKF